MPRAKRGLSYTSEPPAKKIREADNDAELIPFIGTKIAVQSELQSALQEFTSFYSKAGHTCPSKPETELERIQTLVKRRIKKINTALTEQWANNETFELEKDLVIHTVALAILNPVQTEWDVERFAEKAKNTRVNESGDSGADHRLPIYFKEAKFGNLPDPTTILDVHGRVMAWALPGVLHDKRVEDFHEATKGLHDALIESRGDQKTWRGQNFQPPDVPEFEHGTINFSPGWFAQQLERLKDPLHVSTQLKTSHGAKFLTHIHLAEGILNCIGMLICPELFSIGSRAIRKLKNGEGIQQCHENVKLWPSFFSGMQVISNRKTLFHRDIHSSPAMYDFLVSAGRHTGTLFKLSDVDASLSYKPGTVIAICGKVLRHGVPEWTEGQDRLCIAHFMRDAVHNRLGLPRPNWVTDIPYLGMMDDAFLERQGWVVNDEY